AHLRAPRGAVLAAAARAAARERQLRRGRVLRPLGVPRHVPAADGGAGPGRVGPPRRVLALAILGPPRAPDLAPLLPRARPLHGRRPPAASAVDAGSGRGHG